MVEEESPHVNVNKLVFLQQPLIRLLVSHQKPDPPDDYFILDAIDYNTKSPRNQFYVSSGVSVRGGTAPAVCINANSTHFL